MKQITQTELNHMFTLHLKWLNNEEGGLRLDLSECDASGLDFSDQNLCNADLRDANLQGSNFRNTYLRNANLQGANLWIANLQGANLRNAYLWDANLRDANLQGANLWIANLQGANLRDANLWNANLQGADLRNANLWDANLRDANLRDTDFSDTNLSQLRGIEYVTVGWSAHGSDGRTLNCIRIDGVPRFFCGCFRGTEAEIRAFIEGDEDKYKQSRTFAVDFCVARMKEMEAAK